MARHLINRFGKGENSGDKWRKCDICAMRVKFMSSINGVIIHSVDVRRWRIVHIPRCCSCNSFDCMALRWYS